MKIHLVRLGEIREAIQSSARSPKSLPLWDLKSRMQMQCNVIKLMGRQEVVLTPL